MSKVVTKIKQRTGDGYGEEIPFGVSSDNVKCADNSSLTNVLGKDKEDIPFNIAGNTYTIQIKNADGEVIETRTFTESGTVLERLQARVTREEANEVYATKTDLDNIEIIAGKETVRAEINANNEELIFTRN